MASRVAITGIGLVSALGETAEQTFSAVCAGERGLRPLELFEPGDVRSKLVGQVRGLRISDVAARSQRSELSRTDALALVAAREARDQARLPSAGRFGVVLGGTTGGMLETEELLSSPDLPKIAPERARDLVSYPLSASLSHVASVVGGAQRLRSVCSACSGGAIALVQAAAWLESGEVDYVLAGGADALCRLTLLGFNALGATDPEPCRPFDRTRAGLNLGEAGAVMVLERAATAQARGAKVLAWLDGYAVGAEAHHITHPEASGARAIQLLHGALARAQLAPADVGYVNAHGTGTQQNDAMEARALLDVFGAGAGPWVSSSKPQLGHTLGAAGAVEAAITVLALARGQLPPGVGLTEPEMPGLRHVGAQARSERIQAAISSSFGFGGMSCVLALSAAERTHEPKARKAVRVVVLGVSSFDEVAGQRIALDAERSRRFDAASTLASAGAAELRSSEADTGFVLGTAFGNVERTMAFLSRGKARGAKLVPPAEFPHLVPSAPAGNASVYAGLRGPVFGVSELAQSGEAAFHAARDLLELGVTSRVIAGAIAPRDVIVERVLGPLLDREGFHATARGAGGAFALLGTVDDVRDLPEAHALVAWHAAGTLEPPRCNWRLPERRTAGDVVVLGAAGAELRGALAESEWRDARIIDLATEHGYHEALGALALATAARLVMAAEAPRALAISGSDGVWAATFFERAGGS